MFSIAKKSLVGVDIGCESIKVIKLKGIKDNEIVAIVQNRIGCQNHTDDAFNDLTQNALREIVKSKNLSQNASASIVIDPSISFINLKLPPMPKADLMQAVKFEAKKQLTYAVSEAAIDYFIKDEPSEKDPNISITAIAVKKDIVDKHMYYLRNAGLRPESIEIGAVPLLAAYDFNHSWRQGKKTALLDIGASKSILVIVKDMTIRFFREIHICGGSFTEIIKQAYDLSFTEADEKKINLIGHEEGREKDFTDIIDSDKIHSLFEEFALELQRSFDYYQAKYREGSVSELVISGGGALIQGLDAYFSDTLGMEVTIDNPFKKLYFANKADEEEYSRIAPKFAVAVGLALRKV